MVAIRKESGQLLILENQEIEHTTSNGRISQIEHRTEKHERLATPEGEPIRPSALNQREVEHIDHLAITESPLVEKDPIKKTINNVASRTSQNQGRPDHKTQ